MLLKIFSLNFFLQTNISMKVNPVSFSYLTKRWTVCVCVGIFVCVCVCVREREREREWEGERKRERVKISKIERDDCL